MMGARLRIITAASLLVAGFAVAWPTAAQADTCNGDAAAVGDFVAVVVDCSAPSRSDWVDDAKPTSSGAPTEYRYTSVCSTFTPAGQGSADFVDCSASQLCAGQNETLYRLWSRTPPQAWSFVGTQCVTPQEVAGQGSRPQVTPALVLNAIRRIGLPELTAQTQPTDKTLVNFATIFYAQPQPFTRTTTLLGQDVDIVATPSQYTWHHGDGTTNSTATPGAPYPSKDITYSYTDAHTTVTPRVDVTYAARFRVNGGAWQDINETVTITGPTSNLRISEATAVLSGQHE